MTEKIKMKIDDGASGVKTADVALPSNSHTVKIGKKEEIIGEKKERKVQKAITGNVIRKKKSLGKRFTETFIGDGEDVGSVSSYIIYDVIVPAMKSTISDVVSGGIEILLFGETRGTRTKRDRGVSHVSYSNYYDRDKSRRDSRREPTTRNRSRHSFDDVIIGSRGEAEEVLSHLVDLTIDYGAASVADFYDLVDITGEFTDNKYGWNNLSSASVSRVRGGYLINLPRTVLLD